MLCILFVFFIFQNVSAVNLDTVIDAGCTDNRPMEEDSTVPTSSNGRDQDSITIIRDSGGYTIRVVLYWACCVSFATEFKESNDTLYFSINDTSSLQCDCMCHYPFLFRLSACAADKYHVAVINGDRTILTAEFTAGSASVMPIIKEGRLPGWIERDEVYDLRGRRIIGSGMEKNQVYIRKTANQTYKRVMTF